MTHSIEEREPLAKKLRLTPILNTVKSLEGKPVSIHMSHIDYLNMLLTDEVLRRDEVLLMKKAENVEFLYEDACIARINWTVNRQLDRKLINHSSSLRELPDAAKRGLPMHSVRMPAWSASV